MLKLEQLADQVSQYGHSPQARLRGLTVLLRNWNHQRILQQPIHSIEDLSSADVDTIKQLIHAETKKMNTADADTLCEHILFLVLGAIRMQANSDHEYIWSMVDAGITTFVKPEKPRFSSVNLMSISVIFLMLLLISINLMLRKESHEKFYPDEISQSEARRNTLNHLVALHDAMTKGICQLPQAAMLETKQRESYISFINNGQVNIDSAEDLKQALTFVNCLYPQKLMDNPLNQ